MLGSRIGVVLLALVLAVGCGKTGGTSAGSPSDGGNGASAGADDAAGGSLGSGASGGVQNTAGSSGSGANAGAGGGMLPPDGDVGPAVSLHKLDLLLMIDNSRNMTEKQRLLKDAVGWLLSDGVKLSADDIHVGVVTSSLGSHGAAGATDVCVSADADDHAHLIGALRPGLETFQNTGFLAWSPAAQPDKGLLVTQLGPMIDAVGETGCGYEASLEAWYRFLIDPTPPTAVVLQGTLAQPQGIDATILAQRAAFLRPDSVLAIVMLTDENDCSIVDQGYGWLVARAMPLFRSTSACSNPNDPCCQSCGEQVANPGCPALTSDSECAKGTTLDKPDDDLNLRCFEQKRRFGFDLLQPLSRYREGLTRQNVFDRDGVVVKNPIFSGSAPRRHPSQVILTGIVGVPWQDLADQASLTGTGLTYLSAAELEAAGHWDAILGDPEASPPRRPNDPFMIETPTDRGMLSSVHENPFVHESIVPSDSLNPQANKINGHETVNVANRDLQPACTFPLAEPLVCDQTVSSANKACLCFAADAAYNRASCQPAGGGPASTTQYYAQAYPGVRHLRLLRELGDTAVTASICAKVTTPNAPDYGYRPAMKALALRLDKAFNP